MGGSNSKEEEGHHATPSVFGCCDYAKSPTRMIVKDTKSASAEPSSPNNGHHPKNSGTEGEEGDLFARSVSWALSAVGTDQEHRRSSSNHSKRVPSSSAYMHGLVEQNLKEKEEFGRRQSAVDDKMKKINKGYADYFDQVHQDQKKQNKPVEQSHHSHGRHDAPAADGAHRHSSSHHHDHHHHHHHHHHTAAHGKEADGEVLQPDRADSS